MHTWQIIGGAVAVAIIVGLVLIVRFLSNPDSYR